MTTEAEKEANRLIELFNGNIRYAILCVDDIINETREHHVYSIVLRGTGVIRIEYWKQVREILTKKLEG